MGADNLAELPPLARLAADRRADAVRGRRPAGLDPAGARSRAATALAPYRIDESDAPLLPSSGRRPGSSCTGRAPPVVIGASLSATNFSGPADVENGPVRHYLKGGAVRAG